MGASSMEKVMRLPELLAYIIEILRRDRAALLACSLTCSTWHAASRPYIYYSITLDSYAKCTKLQILIDELPIIGRWVRKLKIVGHYNDLGWIVMFPLVLCDQLRRLHTITFQNVRFSQLYLDPEWVTASGFVYFRRLRTLKFLGGCQLKDPELRSIICSVPNLRNLTLDGVILRAAPQESFSQLFTPNVTSVRIGLFCDLANNGFDTWLTNAGSSHHIRSLVLQVPAFGSSMDWRAFGPALESLAIYDSQSILRHYTFFSAFDVSPCRCLRRLAVTDFHCKAGTTDLLKRLPSPQILTHFKFSSLFHGKIEGRRYDTYQELDCLLSSSTFSSLERFYCVYSRLVKRGREDRIVERLATLFPRLVARGVMRVHFVVESELPPMFDDHGSRIPQGRDSTIGAAIQKGDELGYFEDFVPTLNLTQAV